MNDVLLSIPQGLRKAAELVLLKNMTDDEKRFGLLVETFRAEIAQLGSNEKYQSFPSPKKESSLFDQEGKIIPGQVTLSDAAAHARTGTPIFGGIELRRLTEGLGGGSVLELGTNTGLSGCYFLSVPNVHLTTIEGSADLCKIAHRNLARISNQFEILNELFDDAVKRLRDEGRKFDMAFLDGQHEEKATVYYAELLCSVMKPGGALIFDDLYWSAGMHRAWETIRTWPQFSVTLDLSNRGVCIYDPDASERKYFDLCTYVGRPAYYRGDW